MRYVQITTDSFIALHYALKNFEALSGYTSDGMLPIDDNKLEGQIRSVAPEHRNYMVAGSHRAGEPAVVM